MLPQKEVIASLSAPNNSCETFQWSYLVVLVVSLLFDIVYVCRFESKLFIPPKVLRDSLVANWPTESNVLFLVFVFLAKVWNYDFNVFCFACFSKNVPSCTASGKRSVCNETESVWGESTAECEAVFAAQVNWNKNWRNEDSKRKVSLNSQQQHQWSVWEPVRGAVTDHLPSTIRVAQRSTLQLLQPCWGESRPITGSILTTSASINHEPAELLQWRGKLWTPHPSWSSFENKRRD